MSVLIKDMSMPDTCLYCPLCHIGQNGSYDHCEYFFDKVDDLDEYSFQSADMEDRPDFCPLVEVNDSINNIPEADEQLTIPVGDLDGVKEIPVDKVRFDV